MQGPVVKLVVAEPSHPPISWCKVEAVITQPDNICVLSSPSLPPPPPMVVMAMSLRTVPNPKTHQNEVQIARPWR
jgi:DNA polymerase alpha subunit A